LRVRVLMTLMVAVMWSGAVTAPPMAMAQSKGGPDELWEAYPLDERDDPRAAPTPTVAAERPRSLPATAMEDGWPIAVLLGGALAAFLVGALLPQLRRDGPAPAPAGLPRRRVTPRRFRPSTDKETARDRASHRR
jgi:hypothetical protein